MVKLCLTFELCFTCVYLLNTTSNSQIVDKSRTRWITNDNYNQQINSLKFFSLSYKYIIKETKQKTSVIFFSLFFMILKLHIL